MQFKPDLNKKSYIQERYYHSLKEWMALSYGIIAIAVLYTIIFAIYGFAIEDTFLILLPTDIGYGTKNTFLVWTILITTDLILAFLWVIQYMIGYDGVAGRYMSQRANETLLIDESYIEYRYQNATGATPGDRVVVRIKRDTISRIRINRENARIEITGLRCNVYYDNYARRRTRADVNDFQDGTFVVFDYFTPELIPYLENTLSNITWEDRHALPS